MCEMKNIRNSNGLAWFQNYIKLKRYYNLFGHTNIYRADDKQLFAWVLVQKQLYRTTWMSDKQKELLDDLNVLNCKH